MKNQSTKLDDVTNVIQNEIGGCNKGFSELVIEWIFFCQMILFYGSFVLEEQNRFLKRFASKRCEKVSKF